MKRLVIAILSVLTVYAVVYAGNQDEKEKTKSSQRGWLGVSIQDITPELKHSMDLKTEEGVLVSDVSRRGPADSAGIEEGDVIIQFGGNDVEDTHDLQKAVRNTKPGTKVSVSVLRKGERKSLQVTVGKYPRTFGGRVMVAPQAKVFKMSGMGTYGMHLMQVSDQLAEYFGAPDGEGVLVANVREESPAEKAGFKAGDVILRVGKKTIDEVWDVTRSLGAYDEGEKVEIEVLRKGSRKTLTMEIEEEEDAGGFHYRYGPKHPMFQQFQFNAVPDIDFPDVDFEVPEFDIDIPEFDEGALELEMIGPKMDVFRHSLKSQRDFIQHLTRQKDFLRHLNEMKSHAVPLMKSRIRQMAEEI